MSKHDSLNSAPITEAITAFATSSLDEGRAEAALHMTRISLFDWLAVSIAGRYEPVSRIVRDYVTAEGGVAEASVFGMTQKLPARAAAMANGTISHALDYDDTHFAYLGHPSVAVFPASFALAQKIGTCGKAFLEASLIGMEAATRIGAWLGHQHHFVGFHSTATAGAFGAALASARLLNLDVRAAGNALGLVATRASGLRAQFGTMGKPFHAGMAASNGVEAALLAQSGFESRPETLEAEQGFAITHAAAMRVDDEILDGLGQSWMFEAVLHKFHACCHGAHASLEALIEARDSLGVKPDEVANVSLSVPPRYLEVCNILEPQTGLEAKFSYRLCSAMVLTGRDTAALSTYSDAACHSPDLVALRDRVVVNGVDGLAETEATVRITANDGRSVEFTHDLVCAGELALRERKIKAKAVALLGGNSASELWDAVEGADPTNVDEWLRGQNDPDTCTKQASTSRVELSG